MQLRRILSNGELLLNFNLTMVRDCDWRVMMGNDCLRISDKHRTVFNQLVLHLVVCARVPFERFSTDNDGVLGPISGVRLSFQLILISRRWCDLVIEGLECTLM